MNVHDLVIVGDGPAGRALGRACVDNRVDVVVIGPGHPWSSTYAAWADEVGDVRDAAATTMEIDVVGTPPRRRLDRQYLVFDNVRLATLLDVAPRIDGAVSAVHHHVGAPSSVVLADGEQIRARLVIDATGPAPALLARRSSSSRAGFQSAYGLVLEGRPDVGGEAATLMDWRSPTPGSAHEPTFLYVVDVGAGRWLVEETSLVRRTPMAQLELRGRLAARLGRDLTDSAEHVEHVLIPMWPGVPSLEQASVGFGAAAGWVHPATGYSVATSLSAAPRVAAAVCHALESSEPSADAATVWNAVWPAAARRTRALHDVGADALTRLSTEEIKVFFDAFFDLPSDTWSKYLRVDASATDVAKVMSAVFSAVPWTVRRRLALANPLALIRALR